MDTQINVLFVSASTADEMVLSTLLAREGTGPGVRLHTAVSAQAFYEALYSENSFQVIVVDDQQAWSDWQGVIAACSKNRPNALLVLLTGAGQSADQTAALAEGIAAVYPRSSAGMIALVRLVSRLAVQGSSFSLRHEPGGGAAEDEGGDEDGDGGQHDRENLVYAVSHDLQDPLQLARRYAEILNEDFEGELGDSGSKVLGHLQFNLGRTQEMLDELLDYSRLENAPPEREAVDLNELLDEVTGLFQLTLDEIGGTVSRQETLPTLVVDRRQFQRLFQNLIGNAIKFRGDRPLQITVRSQRVGNEWRIGVKDNGIGVAEEDAKRIFGMFERVGSAEDQPGNGMGLAICKRIVNNHGGKIWVRSSPGSGSVFIFSVIQPDDSADDLAE